MTIMPQHRSFRISRILWLWLGSTAFLAVGPGSSNEVLDFDTETVHGASGYVTRSIHPIVFACSSFCTLGG